MSKVAGNRQFKVAVVGATGAVGEVMLSILAERDFPVGELVPLASERSAGGKVEFAGKQVTVRNLADYDFAGVDMVWLNPTPRRVAFSLYETLVMPWVSVPLAAVVIAAATVGAERASRLFESAYDEHARRLAKLYENLGKEK